MAFEGLSSRLQEITKKIKGEATVKIITSAIIIFFIIFLPLQFEDLLAQHCNHILFEHNLFEHCYNFL